MDVQVEVEFTVQHTLEQLREAFVKRGHVPEWKAIEGVDFRPGLYFERRVIALELSSEEERRAWFEFSLEATGELRRRVRIPNVVPADVKLDYPELKEFLQFCRNCLVGPVGHTTPPSLAD